MGYPWRSTGEINGFDQFDAVDLNELTLVQLALMQLALMQLFDAVELDPQDWNGERSFRGFHGSKFEPTQGTVRHGIEIGQNNVLNAIHS